MRDICSEMFQINAGEYHSVAAVRSIHILTAASAIRKRRQDKKIANNERDSSLYMDIMMILNE
jgi:hypothetical protein